MIDIELIEAWLATRTTPNAEGCRIWTRSTRNGYPQLERRTRSGRRLVWLAHRYVSEVLLGRPRAEVVARSCGSTLCVAPAHLVATTLADQARAVHTRPTCRAGHPMDEANTYVRLDGRGRQCRQCSTDRMNRYRQENLEAFRAASRAPEARRRRNARLRRRRIEDAAWRERQLDIARRRHIRKAAGSDLATLIASHHGTCYLCGLALVGPVEVDHVIPVALGGVSIPENVAPTHLACNRRKSDLHPLTLDWIDQATAAPIIERALAALPELALAGA